jgi:amino-acid N-acetyltransferase
VVNKSKRLSNLNDSATPRPEGITRESPKFIFETKQTTHSQASRLIEKFGGAYKLSKLLGLAGDPRTPATIYRWNYPRSRGGSDGIVPSNAWPAIMRAARLEGLVLTSDDIDPRKYQETKKTVIAHELPNGEVRPFVHKHPRKAGK